MTKKTRNTLTHTHILTTTKKTNENYKYSSNNPKRESF